MQLDRDSTVLSKFLQGEAGRRRFIGSYLLHSLMFKDVEDVVVKVLGRAGIEIETGWTRKP